MKVVLYAKTLYGKYYLTDYESNIEFTTSSAYHQATIFDTSTQKDEIQYMKDVHGFKTSKFSEVDHVASQNLNRVYI